MLIAHPTGFEVAPDVSRYRVDIIRPWQIEIWEPLSTKAPNPNLAQPYCCYLNTVIFYVKPYIVRPWHHFWKWRGEWRIQKPGTYLEQWDRVDTVLRWDSVVTFNGEVFDCGGGAVSWQHKRWWMRRWARRRK